ncbi:MAG TPA: formyl-CoA transferase, partial [Gammaproteobacteria bacterium]|nr:formyl-CoA transferase [Gammaproteobacteria bacterium]
RTPGSTRGPGGAIGSHTQTVLSELGYAEEDQQRLRDQGII